MPTQIPEFPSLSIRVPFSLISIAIIPTDHHSPTGEYHSAEEEGGVTSSLAQPASDEDTITIAIRIDLFLMLGGVMGPLYDVCAIRGSEYAVLQYNGYYSKI